MSRRLDDREVLLKRQNRIFFPDQRRRPREPFRRPRVCHAPRQGLVLLVLPGSRLSPGPRHHAGADAAAERGRRRRPASGGRQMPSHWSSPDIHICQRLLAHRDPVRPSGRLRRGRTLPQPATLTQSRWSPPAKAPPAKGEFWEAMNAACLERLPYCSWSKTTATPSRCRSKSRPLAAASRGFSRVSRTFCGSKRTATISWPPTALWTRRSTTSAPARVRPWFTRTSLAPIPTRFPMTNVCTRLRPSAMPKPRAIRSSPIPRWLIRKGCSKSTPISACATRSTWRSQDTDRKGLAQAPPAKDTALRIPLFGQDRPHVADFEVEPQSKGEPRTMVDEINLTLAEEMARDPRIRGLRRGCRRLQPRRKPWRSQRQGRCLQGHARPANQVRRAPRCFNTPIAEAAIVGRAIGMAASRA